jgi:formylglycine-generating enzyme required for sulfatase activity
VWGVAVSLSAREQWAASSAAEQDGALADVLSGVAGAGFTFQGAESFSCAGLTHRLGVFRHTLSEAVFHLVPGQPGFRLDADPDPYGEVDVPPLLVARACLSRGEWARIHEATAPPRPELPAGGISWLAAQAALSRVGLRIPREVEWEHLARAGTRTRFYWGDAFDDRWCWHLANSGQEPHPPSEHEDRANAFGLVDVAGNLWEWCQEDLDLPMEGSAWQEGNPGKVHRGGSFDRPTRYAASSERCGCDPRVTYPDLGVRPVVTLPMFSTRVSKR